MCSTPDIPKAEKPVTIQTPTIADAATSKATTNVRSNAASTAGRNISTTPRGLLDEADTKKKGLLGE